jgi:hypothetical protein
MLGGATAAWFALAAAGQLLMAAYVASFYGRALLAGAPETWNDGPMSQAHVAGDGVGNLVMVLHLGFTVVIVLAGLMQLMPTLRRRLPMVHRWTGRIYILGAVTLALGGLYLVGTRSEDGFGGSLGTSLNGLAILAFAYMALRTAMARRIDAHRRWALRLFIAVSGVWFFRLLVFGWIAFHQAPVGFDPVTFKGPFLTFSSFAMWLLPLAVLELYVQARARGGVWLRRLATGVICTAIVVTGWGIFATTMMLWLPLMRA